jgi:hypothetical protein|tara:strand:+ start:154 stop:297 length:144 start_codon:yes stop_codon:yes gene_type:complete
MSLEHLFYSDFPRGVKYVCVGGKKISKVEFLELKKRYFKKNKLKVDS